MMLVHGKFHRPFRTNQLGMVNPVLRLALPPLRGLNGFGMVYPPLKQRAIFIRRSATAAGLKSAAERGF